MGGHTDCANTAAAAITAARAIRLRQFSKQLERHYPAAQHGGEDGAIPEEILAALQEASACKRRKQDTLFQEKSATPGDAATAVEHVFEAIRPVAVVNERHTSQLADPSAQLEAARSVGAVLNARMSTDFVPQFESSYLSRAPFRGFGST